MVLEKNDLTDFPQPGEPVFYPKVGHCVYLGQTKNSNIPGVQLLELESLDGGARLLVPIDKVTQLKLRNAGKSMDEIQNILSSEFEEPLEDENELQKLIDILIIEGTPRSLCLLLKRLHLANHQESLSRENEKVRKKIRSWLATEVSIEKGCTRIEAQALMTRLLQQAVAEYKLKEKRESQERRRALREQK